MWTNFSVNKWKAVSLHRGSDFPYSIPYSGEDFSHISRASYTKPVLLQPTRLGMSENETLVRLLTVTYRQKQESTIIWF